jgi:ADP-ribosylation factor 1
LALAQAVQAQLISDFGSVHGVWQVLLVGEDQQQSITKLVLVQHALQLFTSFGDTLTVIRVNHEDNTLCILEVWP